MAALPEPWRSLRAEIEKLWRAIKTLQNSSSFEGTGLEVIDENQVLQGTNSLVYVGPDGTFLVDGGDVIMLNDDLVEIFRIGNMPQGDVGLRIKRSDDSAAIEMRDYFGVDIQSLLFLTRTGRIFGGDSVLAAGIAAPYIPLNFIAVDPDSTTLAQSTSSGTFVATHECRTLFQNPAFLPQFKVKCSDGTTAGEIQIYDVLTSTYLGGYFGSPATHTLAIPAGTTTYTVLELASKAVFAGDMGDDMHLEIHVRRTAGAGTVSVLPVKTIGTDV